MSKTRRGFLGLLAKLPGLALQRQFARPAISELLCALIAIVSLAALIFAGSLIFGEDTTPAEKIAAALTENAGLLERNQKLNAENQMLRDEREWPFRFYTQQYGKHKFMVAKSSNAIAVQHSLECPCLDGICPICGALPEKPVPPPDEPKYEELSPEQPNGEAL